MERGIVMVLECGGVGQRGGGKGSSVGPVGWREVKVVWRGRDVDAQRSRRRSRQG